MQDDSITPAPVAPASGDGFLARLGAIISSPGKAMEWVRVAPRWVTAGLVIMAATGLFSAATMHIAGPEQLEIMKETKLGRLVTSEDHAAQMARAENPSIAKRVVQFLSAAAGIWTATFIAALVYLLFTRLAGGTGTLKQVLGVVFWAGIISTGLGSLVRLPLVLAKGSVIEVSTGLGLLVEPNPLSLSYMTLNSFDLFSLWSVAVTSIGFEKIHGFGRGKAAVVTIVPWALMTAVVIGITMAII